jgi:hypothetical protein
LIEIKDAKLGDKMNLQYRTIIRELPFKSREKLNAIYPAFTGREALKKVNIH